MVKTIEPYRRRAHYYETDQMGVIHNSNYLRWFEEARVHFMAQTMYPYTRMEEMGIIIAVLSSYCEYKHPVHFDDEVIIISAMTEFNGYKMTVDYVLKNADSGLICATGETRHCIMNREMKPIRLQKEFPEIYTDFMDCVNEDWKPL